MAIAITDECMHEIDSKASKRDTGQDDGPLLERAAADSPIPFHKHCQKTVCSAYGSDGNGMTWNTLCPGTTGDLANLQNIVGKYSSSTNWTSYFSRNTNNMT